MSNILIVDLEATCWDDRSQSVETMEIIEFGCVVADPAGDILFACSQLVRPTINSNLSQFCQELTTITQSMVAEAPCYEEAINLVDSALAGESFSAWGSWGQYDYRQIKAEKARHPKGLAPAFFNLPHINLKAAWQETLGKKRKAALRGALSHLGLEFEGTQHRARDDAKNIAQILPHIAPDKLRKNTISIPRFLVTQAEFDAASQEEREKYNYLVVDDVPMELPRHICVGTGERENAENSIDSRPLNEFK